MSFWNKTQLFLFMCQEYQSLFSRCIHKLFIRLRDNNLLILTLRSCKQILMIKFGNILNVFIEFTHDLFNSKL